MEDGGKAVASFQIREPRARAPAVVPMPNNKARRPYFPLVMSKCLPHHRFNRPVTRDLPVEEPLLKLVEPGREERAVRVETIPPRSWLSRVVTKERPVSKPSGD